MDEWFRWIIGGLVAFYTAATSWLTVTLFKLNDQNRDKHAQLDRRIALIEARSHIDPVAYAKTMADLANAISNLNNTVAGLHGQISDLKDQIRELEDVIREQKLELAR